MHDIETVLARAGGRQIRDLVTFVGGVDDALAVRRVHGRAEGFVGLQRVWERRRVPCPECGLPTLGGWVGEDRIYCTNSGCATSLSKSDYEQYCERKARRR